MEMMLRADEAVPDGIRRILLELHDAAYQTLNDETVSFDDRVHDTRKVFKCLRAVVRLVRDEVGEDVYKETNVFYRDAGRKLSALRDAWVLVATLDNLVVAVPELTGESAADTRSWLLARYESVRERVLHVDNRVDEVSAELDDFRPRLARLPVQRDGFQALAGGLHRIYRRGYKRMAKAYEEQTDPHLFHDWRKRVKYLWHDLEVLAPCWPVVIEEQMRMFHVLSDYLGDAHDLAVLQQVLREEADAGDGHLSEVVEAAARRQRQMEEAARPVGRRLYAETPDAFVSRVGAYVTVWLETGESPQPPVDEALSALLDTRTAANRLGVGIDDLRSAIRDGQIPAQKVGNQWILRAGDLAQDGGR